MRQMHFWGGKIDVDSSSSSFNNRATCKQASTVAGSSNDVRIRTALSLHKSKGKELQNQRGISIRGITGDRSQAVSRKGRINIETAFKAESAFRLFPFSGSPQIPIPVQISSYCSPSLIWHVWEPTKSVVLYIILVADDIYDTTIGIQLVAVCIIEGIHIHEQFEAQINVYTSRWSDVNDVKKITHNSKHTQISSSRTLEIRVW
jgi:hypothetical protein